MGGSVFLRLLRVGGGVLGQDVFLVPETVIARSLADSFSHSRRRWEFFLGINRAWVEGQAGGYRLSPGGG